MKAFNLRTLLAFVTGLCIGLAAMSMRLPQREEPGLKNCWFNFAGLPSGEAGIVFDSREHVRSPMLTGSGRVIVPPGVQLHDIQAENVQFIIQEPSPVIRDTHLTGAGIAIGGP